MPPDKYLRSFSSVYLPARQIFAQVLREYSPADKYFRSFSKKYLLPDKYLRRFSREYLPPRQIANNVFVQGVKHFFVFFLPPLHSYFPASGQAVVTGVVPSAPRFLPSIFIAHSVQQSHCSSIFHRVLLTHAPALSSSQIVHKKKSQRIYTSMHSAGLELTKLT